MIPKSPKIYVAGQRGMVGSAIVRQHQAMDYHVADAPRNDELTVIASEAWQSMAPASIARTHQELDLCNQSAVQEIFKQEQPTQVEFACPRLQKINEVVAIDNWMVKHAVGGKFPIY